MKVLEFFKRNVGFHHFIFALKFNACSSRCGWIDPNTDTSGSAIGKSILARWDRYLTFSTSSTAANFPLFHQRTDIFVQTRLHLHLAPPLPPFCAVTWLAGARAAVRETRAMTDHGRETAEHSVELFYHSKQKYCSAATWKYINRIVKSVSISDAGPEFIGTGSKPNFAVWHTRNRKTRLQDKYLQENYCYFIRQLFTFLTILYILHTEHTSSGQ